MENKNNTYFYLLGSLSYIGAIQLVQILTCLLEIPIYNRFQSVEITYLSSIIIYILFLIFTIRFFRKKTKNVIKLTKIKTSLIIISFIFIYIIAEILENVHSNIVLFEMIKNFPKEKADYILFSDLFYNLFNILLIIILLIFTYKTRIKGNTPAHYE